MALVEPHAASTSLLSQRPAHPLIAPAEPDPEGLPGAGRLQLGSETATRTCQRAACGLLAAAALPAAGALSASLVCSALLQRVHPCSGPGQSGSSWGCSGVLGVPRAAPLDGASR